MCECERCTFNKLFEEKLAQVPESARQFFSDLHESYCMASQDLDQANAIIDGSWPSADEYLSAARHARAQAQAEAAASAAPRTGVVIDLFGARRRR
jgi:hypothetical protein